MGISLTQYRVTIGQYNIRRWRPSAGCTSTLHVRMDAKIKALGLVNIASLICIILGLSTTIISGQCLQALLMISGIEQNPGPVNQEILDELTRKSLDETTKKIIMAYHPGQDLKAQKRAIGKFKKEELIAALQFLRAPDHSGCNKTELTHNLIVRIQNLLLDTCGLCKEEFNTQLEDNPLLSCEVCGQGSHDPCILKILGQSSPGPHDPTKIRQMLIPLDIAGVHYLCMSCSNDLIPKEEGGKIKKNKAHDKTDKDESDDDSSDDGDPGDEDESPSGGSAPEIPDDTGTAQPQLPGAVGASQPRAAGPQPGADTRPICPYHKRAQCRHGAEGRGCRHRHPQPCKKLIRYGANLLNGCSQGRSKCESWHPSMCPSSMTKGECMDTSCKHWHVIGTKRANRRRNTTSDQQAGTKNQMASKASRKNDTNDFLGLLQKWKTDMMQAMDTKIEMALKASANPQPSLPPMQPLSVMAYNHMLPHNYYNLALGGQRNPMATGNPLVAQMPPNAMYH